MKKKELKNIAKRIAEAEKVIASSSDSNEIRMAQETIMSLSNRFDSTDDMLAVDNMVQEILKNNS